MSDILFNSNTFLLRNVVADLLDYTSQLDYRGLDNGKRKGCRYYAIDGKVLDADLNASNNIGLRYNKHSITCSALDGQVKVKSPIVSVSQRQAPTL